MQRASQVNLASAAAYCVAMPFLLFIAVPVFMIGNSPGDYGFIDFRVVLLTGVILVVAGALLLLACYFGLSFLRKSELAMHSLKFLFWWVLIAGFLLPVTASQGMVDAVAAEINVLNLALTTIAAITLTWLSQTAANQYLRAFAGVLIVFTLATSLYSIARSGLLESKDSGSVLVPESTRLSNTRNVLVISLDGLQGHVVAELLAEDAELATAFKDFTLFENAYSQSPATEASMIGELFGVYDYKEMGDSIEAVKAELVARDIAGKSPLLAADDAFQNRYPFGADAGLGQSDAAATADSVEFLKFALARVATRVAVDNSATSSVFSSLVDVFEEEGSDELAGRLRRHAGPDWDKRLITEVYEYDAYTTQLSVSDKPLSYRYLHFAFTHYPVDFDEHCEYRGDDRKWFARSQNQAGLEKETQCALRKLREHLQKLQELGIYDQSMVVFKSDHGHPTSYFEDYPYNLEINRHRRWGYSRYRPLLMLKPAGGIQNELVVRSELVLLNDLARTICLHGASATGSCEDVPGRDLLDTEDTGDGYFLYVVPTRASSFTFETHISVPVESRIVDPLEALAAAPSVALTERNSSKD